MNGWVGRCLRVNLTEAKHTIEKLDEGLAAAFLGGRGLGVRLFSQEVPPHTEPLSPENKIIFSSGPLVGTGAVTGASCSIITKSPLTGGLSCAKTRGHFGAELKFAGFDVIILEGRAEAPVILSIMDNKIRIVPALEYWGRTTSETEALFRKSLPDQWTGRETFLLCIGPAGERRSPLATVVNDRFLSVGGAGIGAVMGAKNLKAIAVKGQHSVKVADGSRFVQAVNTLINKLDSAPLTGQSMSQWGTAFLVGLCYQKGILPQNNFRKGGLTLKNVGTEALNSAFALRAAGCFSCPIACIKKGDVRQPELEGRGMVPTYLAIGSLGLNCGISDLSVIGMANMLCAEMGLDPIATGGALATVMELSEKKAFAVDDSEMHVGFANSGWVLDAIRSFQKKKGPASPLQLGGREVAQSVGMPELFMGVRGMPLAPFDPRALQGMGLHFATCNYGPNHLYANTFIDELLNAHGSTMDPWETEGKPALVKNCQDTSAALDSLGLCSWPLMGITFKNLVPMINSCLGTGYKAEDLISAGERVWNIERIFNMEAGLSADLDALPERFEKEPISEGPGEGLVSKVREMLPEYYRLRGWSNEGTPLPETLKALGLET